MAQVFNLQPKYQRLTAISGCHSLIRDMTTDVLRHLRPSNKRTWEVDQPDTTAFDFGYPTYADAAYLMDLGVTFAYQRSTQLNACT